MFKPQITVLSLFSLIVLGSISEVSLAQTKRVNADKKIWKRPITYIMPTPRVKPKKYVYQIETRQVTRATHGQLLPSQVAISTRQASGDSTVSLKEKTKRTIASEEN
jgi:hypothetical protein